MRAPASIAARIKVAVLAGLVLAAFAAAFSTRILSIGQAEAAHPMDLAVLLTVGAFVCGIAIALVSSSLAVAPLEGLVRTARAMRRDLGIRTRVKGEDEVGQLGEALDELAGWVGSEKEELEQDRNRLVAILESMAEGVLVTSAQGVVVLANAALRQMFLLDRAIVGRSPIEAIRLAGLDEILARAEESETGASGEIELGGMRPRRVLVRVAPMPKDDDDERAPLVAVFNDVTELRRLESVRRDFVANVSHELRTPIAAISSSAETLADGAIHDPKAAEEFVDIIGRHATRLRRLVEDLLELSRIEAKEWKLEIAPHDPDELLGAAIDAVAVHAAERKAKITRSVAPDVGMVRADRRALDQILVNLIDNAVKYGGAQPTIEVSVAREGNEVIFRVRDHGPGIEPRHLTRIFERFYRVDAGRSRAVGGTGLGLSIVKNLVEVMRGTVEVESEVSVGTTFVVSLPAA
ncbi:MAG: HAMP domain-containing sensor histidine kinase [Polyangiales bacterium]